MNNGFQQMWTEIKHLCNHALAAGITTNSEYLYEQWISANMGGN